MLGFWALLPRQCGNLAEDIGREVWTHPEFFRMGHSSCCVGHVESVGVGRSLGPLSRREAIETKPGPGGGVQRGENKFQGKLED